MLFLTFFALLLLSVVQSRRRELALSNVDKLRYDFLILEQNLWQDINTKIGNEIKFNEVDLIRKFEEFGENRIHKEMPEDIDNGLTTLDSVWVWKRIYADLRAIYAHFESFRRFQKLQTAPNRIASPQQSWIDLINLFMTGSNSIPDSQYNIRDYIENEKLFKEVLKEVQGDMICNTKQSPQQVLYTLYKSIALTELKGYLMMQFSYMLLKLYDKGNFTKEAKIMREGYANRTQSALNSVKEAMKLASKDYWRCDPQKYTNETYVEVTNLVQGYVQNEVDLNSEGTCRENCASYQFTKSHSCFENLYCKQQRRCYGNVINCQYVDSDMWVCPSDPESNRRYSYIEYENGRVLGRKQGGCHNNPVKVDSWWRWIFWHCSYCFCLCDEESIYSDRYFNMRAARADILNNKVITGLRFIKHNRIIHLQIQEGKLLPGGEIDVETVHWVPVEDYKITDKKIYKGQDYHSLNWFDREIDLDDVEAEEGHVLTGVRFKKIGSHLNFEIFITPFNFTSGQLIDPLHKSFWKENLQSYISEEGRKAINTERKDIPIRSPLPSIPVSKSGEVIQFTQTDMDRDVSQTTVPFIDSQSVDMIIPVPLSGAGIYYKTQSNFGGFIAPKIITYDYSNHLRAEFPKEDKSNSNNRSFRA